MKSFFGNRSSFKRNETGNGRQQQQQQLRRSLSDITILSVTNEYDTALHGRSDRSGPASNDFSLSTNKSSSLSDQSDSHQTILRPGTSNSNASGQGSSPTATPTMFETGINQNGTSAPPRNSRLSSGFGMFLRYAAPFISSDGVPGAPVRRLRKPKSTVERISSRFSSLRLSHGPQMRNGSSLSTSLSPSKNPGYASASDSHANAGLEIVEGMVKVEEIDTCVSYQQQQQDDETVFDAAASKSDKRQSKSRASWSISSIFGGLFSSPQSKQKSHSPNENDYQKSLSRQNSAKSLKSMDERTGSTEISNVLTPGSFYSSQSGSFKGRDKSGSTNSLQDDDVEVIQFQHQKLHSILLLHEAFKELNKKHGSKTSMNSFSEGESEVLEGRLRDKISARIIVNIASAAEYLAEKGTEIEANGGVANISNSNGGDKSISTTPKSSLSGRIFGRVSKINEKPSAFSLSASPASSAPKNNFPTTPPNPVLSNNFAGLKRPKIPLDRYLTRIVRYLNTFHEQHPSSDSVGTRCLIVAAHFIDRLRLKYSDPLIGSGTFQLNQMNVHRLFLVACLLAVKMIEDDHPTNEYMANVGGVELKELDLLESQFCNAMEFDFHLNPLEIQQLYNVFDPEQNHTLKEPTGDGAP